MALFIISKKEKKCLYSVLVWIKMEKHASFCDRNNLLQAETFSWRLISEILNLPWWRGACALWFCYEDFSLAHLWLSFALCGYQMYLAGLIWKQGIWLFALFLKKFFVSLKQNSNLQTLQLTSILIKCTYVIIS